MAVSLGSGLSPSLARAAEPDRTCQKGLQVVDKVCVPDKMAAYLLCLERTGSGRIHLQKDDSAKKSDSVKVDLSAAGEGLKLKGSGQVTVAVKQERDSIARISELFNPTLSSRDCLRAAGFDTDRGIPLPPVAPSLGAKVAVKLAKLGRTPLSKEACTFDSPCRGLVRGSILHVELNRAGYAAAYIQDKGSFYNQEGRLFIASGEQGDVGLWPGTKEAKDQVGYPLFIVSSDKAFAPTQDSDGLGALPAGEHFGPVYLRVENPIAADIEAAPPPNPSEQGSCHCDAGGAPDFLSVTCQACVIQCKSRKGGLVTGFWLGEMERTKWKRAASDCGRAHRI